jgi:hypothetical protein
VIRQGGGRYQQVLARHEWPLDLTYAYQVADDGSASQTTTVHQEKLASELFTASDQ